MISAGRLLSLGLSMGLSLLAVPAAAQLGTTCNPRFKTCPPIRGSLATNKFFDFRKMKSPPPTWTMSWWGTPVEFNESGATLHYTKQGESPLMMSDWYMEAGRVDVAFKIAIGRGMVTSMVMWSDVLDELDWEFTGGNFGHSPYPPPDGNWEVQINAFTLGHTVEGWRVGPEGRYNATKPHEQFHVYSFEWDIDILRWYMDGQIIREMRGKGLEMNYGRQVETPLKMQLGLWAGGDPGQPFWTRIWAGGDLQIEQAPFHSTWLWANFTQVPRSRTCQYEWISNSGNRDSFKKSPGPYGLCWTYEKSTDRIVFHDNDPGNTKARDIWVDLKDPRQIQSWADQTGFTYDDIKNLINLVPPEVLNPPSTTESSTTSTSSTSTTESSTSTTVAAPTASSTDGKCGNGITCTGTPFGRCCSEYGYCGTSPDHCGKGCQETYGVCGDNIQPLPETSSVDSTSSSESSTTSLEPDTTLADSSITLTETRVRNAIEAAASTESSDESSTAVATEVTIPTHSPTSTESTTSSAPPPPPPTAVSSDGTCGNGVTCFGSGYGRCCSPYGYCGVDPDHCGDGCQAAYGVCGPDAGSSSESTTVFESTSVIASSTVVESITLVESSTLMESVTSVAIHESTSLRGDFTTASEMTASTTSSESTKSTSTSSTPTSTSTPPPPAPTAISTDGTCGNGVTCFGSGFGRCCSKYGYCGVNPDHCDEGCQEVYGVCGPDTGSSSESTTVFESTSVIASSTVVESITLVESSTTTESGTSTAAEENTMSNNSLITAETTPSTAPAESTASTSTSTPPPPAPTAVSTDGLCGNGVTCFGSGFGRCCSKHGYCGVTLDHCIEGCQAAYGVCGPDTGAASESTTVFESTSVIASDTLVESITLVGGTTAAASTAMDSTVGAGDSGGAPPSTAAVSDSAAFPNIANALVSVGAEPIASTTATTTGDAAPSAEPGATPTSGMDGTRTTVTSYTTITMCSAVDVLARRW